MKLRIHNIRGEATETDAYASAEALVQAESPNHAVEVAFDDVFWVPAKGRLVLRPDVTTLPAGGRTAAARNEVDRAVLSTLSNDTNLYVRWGVANNNRTTPEDRLRLNMEGLGQNLQTIAKHSSKKEILHTLSSDPDWMLRLYVAKNKNTSAETLRRLSTDDMYLVRIEVAKNLNTDIDTLRALTSDDAKDVSTRATMRLRTLEKIKG